MPRVSLNLPLASLNLVAVALAGQDSLAAPRDTLKRHARPITSQAVFDSAFAHDLPITDVRQLLDLLPGVVETRDARGVSLRGSDPGGTAVYVDGALITNGNRTTDLLFGTNGIATGTVTAGAVGAAVGDAQSGAISLLTPSGGPALRASLRYRTDNVGFDPWRNVGLQPDRGEGGRTGDRRRDVLHRPHAERETVSGCRQAPGRPGACLCDERCGYGG